MFLDVYVVCLGVISLLFSWWQRVKCRALQTVASTVTQAYQARRRLGRSLQLTLLLLLYHLFRFIYCLLNSLFSVHVQNYMVCNSMGGEKREKLFTWCLWLAEGKVYSLIHFISTSPRVDVLSCAPCITSTPTFTGRGVLSAMMEMDGAIPTPISQVFPKPHFQLTSSSQPEGMSSGKLQLPTVWPSFRW